MKKRTISISLILILILCSTATVFADDIDFSQWDSTRNPGAHSPANPHPADVVGTRLILPVSTLIEMGIITGDVDGLFHPNRTITRAEFAAMMARTVRAMDLIAATKDERVFTDLAGHGWAVDYINAATNAGIFTGRGDGIFAPGDNVTYAEVITAIIRLNPRTAQAAAGMAATWPENYIHFARMYNVVGDVIINDWNAPATRGNVAWLLFRVVPREADDVVELRNIIVNGNSITLAGRSLSTNLIGTTNATITVNAMQGGSRILIHDNATNALLTEGLGSVTVSLTNLDLPHTVRITVMTGTGATAISTVYTLRLN